MMALFNLGGGEIIMLLVMFMGLPLALAATVFWIWMLIHAIRNPALSDGERIAWVLVIVFLHLLGGIIYFFAGRKETKVLSTA